MVPMLAMHMAVRNLLRRGHANARHAQAELERLAGQRMVAVEDHLGALDLHHVEDLRLTPVVAAFELAADLDAGKRSDGSRVVGDPEQRLRMSREVGEPAEDEPRGP